MTPLEYAPHDGIPRSAPVRFLFRHNPFYLLSAMCMLAGCLCLTNSLSWTSIGLGRLLALVFALNFYEALLLGLGLFLLARRGVIRDGLVLLFLEALFLVDAAFLNVEVFAVDLHVGLLTNLAVYALALAKLFVLFRALGLRLDRTFAFVVAQVTALFCLPGAFAVLSRGGDGSLPPQVAYAAWWALGAVAAASVLMVRPRAEEDRYVMSASHHRVGSILRRTFVLLPFLSLLVHLVTLHWVYNAHVYAAFVSPLLLGLAVGLAPATPSAFAKRADVALLRALLPLTAVIFSADAPSVLVLTPFEPFGRDVTPLFMATWGAYGVYVYLYLARFAPLLLPAGAAVAALYLFGPAPAQVAAGTKKGANWGYGRILRLVPSTTAGWGVVGVCAAFAFLAIGAMISLRKPPSDDEVGEASGADRGTPPSPPDPVGDALTTDASIIPDEAAPTLT
jgi:multidrug transporter EmrE-like cation transporter